MPLNLVRIGSSQSEARLSALILTDLARLCHDYALGGLSPRLDTLKALKSKISIPIYVMIRPHADHFCYSTEHYQQMKTTIEAFKEQGADGFVFGILRQEPNTPHLSVDLPRNKALVALADGRPCTFHRAFDLIPDPEWDNALAALVECGFSSILTNGGPSGNSAVECTDQLSSLIHDRLDPGKFPGHSQDQLPQVIVGGGVRSKNIEGLFQKTGATAFHSAALAQTTESVSSDEVRALRAALDQAT